MADDESNERIMRVRMFLEAMQGITYDEWKKLQMVVDENFKIQLREFEKSIQLTELELRRWKDVIKLFL